MKQIFRAISCAAVYLIFSSFAFSQNNHDAPDIYRNISYRTIDGHELLLDVFSYKSATPSPVIVYYHGGGWVNNTRAKSWKGFSFFLSLGMSVVNVDYRLAGTAKAPAAVEDVRASLGWVAANAAKYNFDTKRIVTYGTSAGGHLALMAGLVPSDAGFDSDQNGKVPRAAAVLDFYGITDVADLLDGTNKRGWANTWIGNGSKELAVKMSPLTYVGKNTPPVFIVHGDSDPTVPYSHARRLKKALDDNKIPAVLFTVPGGKHGNFPNEEMKEIGNVIKNFLQKQGIVR
jgi:acetyl esterase/lipase